MVACFYREGDTVIKYIVPILASSAVKKTRSKVIKREVIGRFQSQSCKKAKVLLSSVEN
jgi:hypothetical protein